MKTIIHIGYPKTATTWFQNKFFPKIKNARFFKKNEVSNDFINVYKYHLEYDRLKEKYTVENEDYLLISNEDLVGTINYIGLNRYATKENAQRLYAVFPEAKIIIFIRNQFDIIASTYMQYLKGGGTYSIKKYLFHKNKFYPDNMVQFSFEYFEYHKTIELYCSLFGENNVKVFLYEDFSNDKIRFLKRMKEEFSFDVNVDRIDFSEINKGYRKGIIYISKLFNLFSHLKRLEKYYIFHIPGWFFLSKRILNYLNRYQIFGEYADYRFLLDKKTQCYIKDFYKSSNRILIEKYHLSEIKTNLYPL